VKRVGHLFERIVDSRGLLAAAHRAARGKRDSPLVARFLVDRETEVLALQAELLAGSYRPGPFRTFTVHDPKTRLISAPAFGDRVVHHAVCSAIEPVLERVAVHDSYACRIGRGAHRALDRAQQFARAGGYFLKLDVEHYYDTVDHAVLKHPLPRSRARRSAGRAGAKAGRTGRPRPCR
jgi:retron-type reverse transcriptase